MSEFNLHLGLKLSYQIYTTCYSSTVSIPDTTGEVKLTKSVTPSLQAKIVTIDPEKIQ